MRWAQRSEGARGFALGQRAIGALVGSALRQNSKRIASEPGRVRVLWVNRMIRSISFSFTVRRRYRRLRKSLSKDYESSSVKQRLKKSSLKKHPRESVLEKGLRESVTKERLKIRVDKGSTKG